MSKIYEEKGVLHEFLKKEQNALFNSEIPTLEISNMKLVEHDPGKRNKITSDNQCNCP